MRFILITAFAAGLTFGPAIADPMPQSPAPWTVEKVAQKKKKNTGCEAGKIKCKDWVKRCNPIRGSCNDAEACVHNDCSRKGNA